MLGVSRQPIMFISVDLPEPDGPMMATYSPRSMLEIDAAQGVDFLRAHHVGLPQVVGFDDWHDDTLSRRAPGHTRTVVSGEDRGEAPVRRSIRSSEPGPAAFLFVRRRPARPH